jgi:threonine/homoserine/homoserine lactone efflux protein
VNVYVQGLLFGMVLQLSVGPVCLAVFQRAITGRLRWALWMVLGVAMADGIYIALALAGVSSLLQFATIRTGLGLAGSMVLAYFGIRGLLTPRACRETPSVDSTGRASFRYGFVLTMTNPLTIVFWGGVFAGLAAGSGIGTTSAIYLFAAGCVSATLFFLSAIARLGNALGALLDNPTGLMWLNRIVGLFILGFALKLALDVVGQTG